MLDTYLYGQVTRLSPEAPVPVVNVNKEEFRPGGAGNVALNLASLGAKPILLALIGSDKNGDKLKQILNKSGVITDLVSVSSKPTIVKTRIVSNNHQMIRFDYEIPFDQEESKLLDELIKEKITEIDVVVLSDYAKGTLGQVSEIIKIARENNKIIIVDPKGTDFSRYYGATIITPNLVEFQAIVGRCTTDEEIVIKAHWMLNEFNLNAVLVTKGELGMTLVQNNAKPEHYAATAREVADVTGAGDTVIALLAASIASGYSLSDAVILSNLAAGIVVSKFGTATITKEELNTF